MKRALVVWLLCVVNVLAYLAVAASDVALLSPSPEALQRWGASYGPLLTSGDWWRLLASAFLCAGLQHLLIALWLLVAVAAVTERLFGHVELLVIYLLSAMGGALLAVYWQPGSTVAGALPAVFGVSAALLAFVLRSWAVCPPEERSSLRTAGLAVAVSCLVLGLASTRVDVPGLTGGSIVGVILGFALAPPRAVIAPAARVRRAALTVLAGCSVLGLAAWSLPAEDDWRKDLQALFALDGSAESQTDEARQNVAAGRMSREAYRDFVEREVLPPWRQHRAHMAGLRLSPRPRALIEKAIEYMDRRATAWERLDDPSTTAAATEASREFMRVWGLTFGAR